MSARSWSRTPSPMTTPPSTRTSASIMQFAPMRAPARIRAPASIVVPSPTVAPSPTRAAGSRILALLRADGPDAPAAAQEAHDEARSGAERERPPPVEEDADVADDAPRQQDADPGRA